MVDFLIILLIAAILGGAGFYIYKSKRPAQNVSAVPTPKIAAVSTAAVASSKLS